MVCISCNFPTVYIPAGHVIPSVPGLCAGCVFWKIDGYRTRGRYEPELVLNDPLPIVFGGVRYWIDPTTDAEEVGIPWKVRWHTGLEVTTSRLRVVGVPPRIGRLPILDNAIVLGVGK